MTFAQLIQAFQGICTLISLACAIYVTVRAGRWRDGDEVKAMLQRIDHTESRLDILETQHKQLATKADVAELEGKLEAVNGLLKLVQSGVNRIEGFMIGEGRR